MISRSILTVWPMPGRWTFTATVSPLGSTARCTWAMDADATGVSQNSEKTESMESPSSASTICLTWAKGKDGTLSWSFSSSAHSSCGIISGRVPAICPNLTKDGPSSSRAIRIRSHRVKGVVWTGSLPSSGRLPKPRRRCRPTVVTRSPNPCFSSTVAI